MKTILHKTVAVVLVLALAGTTLTGCETLGINKETGGAVTGASAGALVGYAIGTATGATLVWLAAGSLLGGFLGSRIGRDLDQKDRVAMATATQETLEKKPSGKVTNWKNPDTGRSGTVVANPAFKNEKGENCREFTQTFNINGKTEKVIGMACRQPDGVWRIVS